MREVSSGLRIVLGASVRVEDAAGHPIPLKSQKQLALLAVLATAPEMSRNRNWIQKRLWGSFFKEQAANNLRQAVSSLKKSFGVHADALCSNRTEVSLVSDKITVVRNAVPAGQAFLEDLTITEPDFKDWLDHERLERSAAAAKTTFTAVEMPTSLSQRMVVVLVENSADQHLKQFENQIVDCVVRSIRENTPVEVATKAPETAPPSTQFVNIQVFKSPNQGNGLRILLEDADRSITKWSQTVLDVDVLQNVEHNVACLNLINSLIEAVSDSLAGNVMNVTFDRDANLLGNLAIRKIFSIEKGSLETADRLLQKAYEIDPRGVFQAWRAQLFTIQYVERFSDDIQGLVQKSEEACALAVAADASNSNVLAAVANAKIILQKNIIGGLELARMGVKANPANPLAWWALSNAKQYCFDYRLAYAAAVRAQVLASGTRLKFWSDFQRSLTAALLGKSDEALRIGEISSALGPNFKPPLRYLTALYSNDGHDAQAKRSFQALKKLELDFSMDQFLNDEKYPISLLRKSELFNQDKLKDIGI